MITVFIGRKTENGVVLEHRNHPLSFTDLDKIIDVYGWTSKTLVSEGLEVSSGSLVFKNESDFLSFLSCVNKEFPSLELKYAIVSKGMRFM